MFERYFGDTSVLSETEPHPPPHTQKNQVADKMTEAVTEAVLTIAEPGKPIDLHMVGDFGGTWLCGWGPRGRQREGGKGKSASQS